VAHAPLAGQYATVATLEDEIGQSLAAGLALTVRDPLILPLPPETVFATHFFMMNELVHYLGKHCTPLMFMRPSSHLVVRHSVGNIVQSIFMPKGTCTGTRPPPSTAHVTELLAAAANLLWTEKRKRARSHLYRGGRRGDGAKEWRPFDMRKSAVERAAVAVGEDRGSQVLDFSLRHVHYVSGGDEHSTDESCPTS